MRYANKKHMNANGQRINTIHQGVMLPGFAALRVLPQYHRAAIQICCDPCTMHARSAQVSVAAPYETRQTCQRRPGQGTILTASSPKFNPKNANAAAEEIA